MSKHKGVYVVVEGIDGSGKTTQFNMLLDYLGPGTVSIREPGGTPMSEHIRDLVKDKNIPRSARTNMFLFTAARADLIDRVIQPALKAGKTVLCDRNWLSTVALQGAEGADTQDIIHLARMATGELFMPDVLLILDLDPKRAALRINSRGGYNNQADYFDSKGEGYHARVRKIYLEQATKLERAAVIDGDGTPEEVHQRIKDALHQYVKLKRG